MSTSPSGTYKKKHILRNHQKVIGVKVIQQESPTGEIVKVGSGMKLASLQLNLSHGD